MDHSQLSISRLVIMNQLQASPSASVLCSQHMVTATSWGVQTVSASYADTGLWQGWPGYAEHDHAQAGVSAAPLSVAVTPHSGQSLNVNSG